MLKNIPNITSYLIPEALTIKPIIHDQINQNNLESLMVAYSISLQGKMLVTYGSYPGYEQQPLGLFVYNLL